MRLGQVWELLAWSVRDEVVIVNINIANVVIVST